MGNRPSAERQWPSHQLISKEIIARSPSPSRDVARSTGTQSPDGNEVSPHTPVSEAVTPPREMAEKSKEEPKTPPKSEEPTTPPKSPSRDVPTAVPISPATTPPRSPSDPRLHPDDQPGLGTQLIMGINGLWSSGRDWWYATQPSSPAVATKSLSAENIKSQRLSVKSGKDQSAESDKDEDVQTCMVLIKAPEKGRYTVHKHDPAYQTLYGLADPFGEDKKKDQP